MHQESWVGSINLDKHHVKLICFKFIKCPQCRTIEHFFPSCPLMKNWIIKKETRGETALSPATIGGVNLVLNILMNQKQAHTYLPTLMKLERFIPKTVINVVLLFLTFIWI
jgi:hypothetical protein